MMRIEGQSTGVVSVTALAADAAGILRDVRAGRVVPVSKHGEVVAVVRPIDERAAFELGFGELTAGMVTAHRWVRGDVSPHVARAAAGETVFLTHQQRPVAALLPASAWEEVATLRDPARLGRPSGPVPPLSMVP